MVKFCIIIVSCVLWFIPLAAMNRVTPGIDIPVTIRTLRGQVVKAENGTPLSDATIFEKGTSNSVRTDAQGKWTMDIQGTGKVVLSITAIGRETKEIEVDLREKNIVVRLKVQNLEEQRGDLKKLQNTKVTLNLRNVPVVVLLKEIQRQTGFYFVYTSQEVEDLKTVSSVTENGSVKEVLDNVFVWNQVNYEFTRNGVIVLKKAQKKMSMIRGQIMDNSPKPQPVPFATVAIKGSSIGTTTDADGRWVLNVIREERPLLVFSFVGMNPVEYRVEPNSPEFIPITMTYSETALDEVVVTGYEKIDKRKMTGSVVSMKGSDVIEPVGSTIDKMLQGKLAGVTVMQNTSTPGAAPKIRIRGNSTILGNREPVWVVDGIVMEDPVKISAAELNSMDRVNLVGNAISFLNPEDIDRIDVLKDVSATAIYGVKAANGVVVVTTKRGRVGKPSVSYSLAMSIKNKPSYGNTNLMNSNERIDVSEEIARRGLLYAGSGVGAPNLAYEGLLQAFWNRQITYGQFVDEVNVLRSENTDWFGTLMRDAFSQTHNLSIQGGSERSRYYFSLNYTDDQDAQKFTGLNRYTMSSNTDFQLLDRLKLGVGISAAHSQTKRTHSLIDLLQYSYETARTIKLREKDGSLSYYPLAVFDPGAAGTKQDITYNILNELTYTGNSEKTTMVNLNLTLNYGITSWLSFNGIFGYSVNDVDREEFADDQSFYISERRGVPYGVAIPDDATFKSTMDIPFGGELKLDNTRQNTYNLRAAFSLTKDVGSGFLDVQVGTEIRSSKNEGESSTAWGYLRDRGKQFTTIDLSEYDAFRQRVQANHPIIRDNLMNTVSWFGIGRYSLMNKYTFNLNVRCDGSNRFGSDGSNRFLPVWSVSGRWNMHSENFMKNVDFLDMFALKVSYGAQGNVVEGQTPYMVIRQGTFYTATNQYSSALNNFPNPELKWEKTMSWQVGLDFSVFDGIISGTFEYYSKIGKDQVVTKQLAYSTGIESTIMNGGTLKNKGWELGISGQFLNKKDWKWSGTFNVSHNTSRVENTEDPGTNTYTDYLGGSVILNGETVNSFYSYRFDGLNKDSGLPMFKGIDLLDENGVPVSTFEEAIGMSMVRSGQRDPKISGGLTTNVKYRGLSLNMNFAYSLGNKIRLNALYKNAGQQLPLPQQNWSKDFVHRWQKPGDEEITNIPVLSDQKLVLSEMGDRSKFSIGDNYWQMYNYSDFRVVSGSFLRCTSVSLNYSFQENVYRHIGAKGLSCVFTCNNLFVISDSELNGKDPEQISFGSRTLPPQRTYSFSMNVNF